MAKFGQRHPADIKVFEDVAKAAINLDGRTMELCHIAGDTSHPEVGRKGEGPLGSIASTASKAGSSGRHRIWQIRSEEHTSELQSRPHLVCRLLLEKKK